MNISGIFGYKYPGQCARVLKKYEGENLEFFLRDQVKMRDGFSPPAADQFLLDAAEYDAYIADAQAAQEAEKQEEVNIRDDAELKSFFGMTSAEMDDFIESKTTLPALKNIVKMMAKDLWLRDRGEFR